MEKKLIRKNYLQKRHDLEKIDFNTYSKKITDLAIGYIKELKPLCIHCFLSINSKLELNTNPIIDYCWSNGIKVVVPISDFKSSTMKTALYNSNTNLVEKDYNILEPENPILTRNDEIDIIITPLLAFDINGFRVGYGKGFYDKFFSAFKSQPIKMGLSMFEPIKKISDVNSYDIPLNICVTPKKIYSFS